MNTFIARVVFYIVGVLPAFVVIPVAHAEVPIFYGGYTLLTPAAQGSYVHWSRRTPPFDYEKQSGATVGQVWTIDGQNHQVQYFDIYRAFVIFDVPRYKGIVTRDEIGIPDWAVPDVTSLRTKVLSAELGFQQIKEDDLGADLSPIEVRWSSLPASAILNGTIDPAVAFNGLLSAPRVETDPSGLHESNSPTGVSLNDSFIDFLKHTDGGPVIFSFTMPLVDSRGTLDLKYLIPDVTLNITYDGYAPLSPVPEPATYACAGAALCAILAARRTIKSRRPVLKKLSS